MSAHGKKEKKPAGPAKGDGGGKADGRGGGGKGPGSGKSDGATANADGKGKGCFTCGGDHRARDCPKGKGKDGKKGRRDRKGKGKGDASSGSDSDGSSTRPKIPADQMCCIRHFWRQCEKGDACNYPHLDKPTEVIKSHPSYLAMEKKHGKPTVS